MYIYVAFLVVFERKFIYQFNPINVKFICHYDLHGVYIMSK